MIILLDGNTVHTKILLKLLYQKIIDFVIQYIDIFDKAR